MGAMINQVAPKKRQNCLIIIAFLVSEAMEEAQDGTQI